MGAIRVRERKVRQLLMKILRKRDFLLSLSFFRTDSVTSNFMALSPIQKKKHAKGKPNWEFAHRQ
jgi:hypothetical protein